MTESTDHESTDAGTVHPGATSETAHASTGAHLEGRGYTVSSFVMAVLAMLVIPPLHGIIGASLGYIGYHKGDPLGRTAMVCSLAAMVVGSIVAAVAFRSVT